MSALHFLRKPLFNWVKYFLLTSDSSAFEHLIGVDLGLELFAIVFRPLFELGVNLSSGDPLLAPLVSKSCICFTLDSLHKQNERLMEIGIKFN